MDHSEDSKIIVDALQSLSVSSDVNTDNQSINNNNNNGNIGNSEHPVDTSRKTYTNTTTVLNPIYIPTASGNDTWELTWPIWHMLPVGERKAIAKQNGFKSIGEFEESVILSRALSEDFHNNSTNNSNNANTDSSIENGEPLRPYSSEELYEFERRPQNYGLPILAERSHLRPKNNNNNDNNNNDDDDESDSGSSMDDDVIRQTTDYDDNNNNNETIMKDEEIENGGLMLLLPHDLIIYYILPYLSIEHYAACALVSPHWKYFTRTETVYKEICKRCYLQQSKRKTLHVHRFNGSYHTMLHNRFRVKTGCGFYVLKCTKIKKIQRDMWTEVPIGAILESTYYRYINFFENGTLLYALTSKPPHEMIPIFQKMKQLGSHSHHSVNAVLGKYEIQKDIVTVNVTHPWHHVRLVLRVLMDGYPGSLGRFWALEFEKHWSSNSGDFDEYWSRDLVEYKVPDEPIFRFLRDWRL